MEIKVKQAAKMNDDAVDEFIDYIHTLAKDASVEDIMRFVEDDSTESEDKVAMFVAFIETHKEFKNFFSNIIGDVIEVIEFE